MLLTWDRMRIPWQTKQISLETVIPVLAHIGINAVCAINTYTLIACFGTVTVILGYIYRYTQRKQLRTRFFFIWLVCSVLYMITIFELNIPLLMVLPEENFILVILTISSIFCLYRTKLRATQNFVLQSAVHADELPDITEASVTEEEEAEAITVNHSTALLIEHELQNAADALHQPNICEICHKYVPSRTFHCSVCSACILRQDHHSYWLNCCIGEYNHAYFLGCLLLGELALLFGADILLTSVCRPFSITRIFGVTVVLPDDCSEVFESYESSVPFVISVYALMMAIYVLATLLCQIFLISRGITMHEWWNGHRGNRKNSLANLKTFIF